MKSQTLIFLFFKFAKVLNNFLFLASQFVVQRRLWAPNASWDTIMALILKVRLKLDSCFLVSSSCMKVKSRAETKALIVGGGAYSYIRVLPDEFLLKSIVMTTGFKRNSSGRT